MKLETVRRHCLSLPDAVEAPHHHYTSFRVPGGIFATAPPEGDLLHVMVGEEQREQAIALYPGFIEKLFWGGKAVGLRIRLRNAEPAVVRRLLDEAHARRGSNPRRRGQAPRG